MNSEKSIELLKQQIEKANPLKIEERFSPNFIKWKRDTEIVIEKIFGKDSRHLKDFDGINYHLLWCTSLTPDSEFQEEFNKGIDEAKQILNSMVDEVLEFGIENEKHFQKVDSLNIIENICNRFHLVARLLRSRYNNRTTLEIEDEYDVQDLLHSLLHLYFDDIRPEEWTPSYAGGSSRIDFLLKKKQILVESKKTRKDLTTRDIGDQLIIDTKRYRSHPDCKCLFCFIYDPEGRIANPNGLENDLTEESEAFKTVVVVSPKGR